MFSNRLGKGNAAFGMRFVSVTLPLLSGVLLCFVFSGDRTSVLNDTKHQVEFKSNQWFGATVRSHGDTILVRRSARQWGEGLLVLPRCYDLGFHRGLLEPHGREKQDLGGGVGVAVGACFHLKICPPDYCPLSRCNSGTIFTSRFDSRVENCFRARAPATSKPRPPPGLG